MSGVETPKCRLCGCDWWVEAFKLQYKEHVHLKSWVDPPEVAFIEYKVGQANRTEVNQSFQCAKCGAVMTVEHTTGNVEYDLSTRHGNVEAVGINHEAEQRGKEMLEAIHNSIAAQGVRHGR